MAITTFPARQARTLHGLLVVTLVLTASCRAKEAPGGAASADPVQPAAQVAAQLPRTNVTIADRARWLARLRWPGDCEDAFTQTHLTDEGGLDFHELAPGRFLVVVRCALGAYQPSQLVLRVDERQAPPAVTILDFPTFESSDGKSVAATHVAELAGELTLLDGGHVLTVLSLARQIGDCGTWARYRIADGEGMPRLELFAERVACPDAPGERADPAPGLPPKGWRLITR